MLASSVHRRPRLEDGRGDLHGPLHAARSIARESARLRHESAAYRCRKESNPASSSVVLQRHQLMYIGPSSDIFDLCRTRVSRNGPVIEQWIWGDPSRIALKIAGTVRGSRGLALKYLRQVALARLEGAKAPSPALEDVITKSCHGRTGSHQRKRAESTASCAAAVELDSRCEELAARVTSLLEDPAAALDDGKTRACAPASQQRNPSSSVTGWKPRSAARAQARQPSGGRRAQMPSRGTLAAPTSVAFSDTRPAVDAEPHELVSVRDVDGRHRFRGGAHRPGGRLK